MNAIVAHQWTHMGFTALSVEKHWAGRLGTMLSMTWSLEVLPQLELPSQKSHPGCSAQTGRDPMV